MQVSHHPPASALHVEHKDWIFWQEFSLASKFRGKYLQVIPHGTAHLKFNRTGNHYSWKKVTTTVHNIIVGKLWIDQVCVAAGMFYLPGEVLGGLCYKVAVKEEKSERKAEFKLKMERIPPAP